MAFNERLLKTQRNAVFNLILQAKLYPTEFSWSEEEVERSALLYMTSVLTHVPSRFSCQFSSFRLVVSPGEHSPRESIDYRHTFHENDWTREPKGPSQNGSDG